MVTFVVEFFSKHTKTNTRDTRYVFAIRRNKEEVIKEEYLY